MEKTIIAKEGMRVHVFSPDQNEDWGHGTIEKVEVLVMFGEDNKTVTAMSGNYPSKIKLDSGKMTEGMECWWYPIDEKVKGESK